MIDRRTFLYGLTVGTLATPLAARAQQAVKVYRIAVVFGALSTAAEMTQNNDYKLLIAELRGVGYVEGHNLIVERWVGEGRPAGYPELAREIAQLKPDVIVAASGPLIRAFKAATTTIPIVGITADFVAGGLVASLARPGGNITGFSIGPGEGIYGKRLQLLRHAVPRASKVAFLVPRASWDGRFGLVMRRAAEKVGLSAIGAALNDPIGAPEYRRAFLTLARERVDILVVTEHAKNYAHQRVIARLAADASLPTIYPYREAIELDGLLAYSADLSEM